MMNQTIFGQVKFIKIRNMKKVIIGLSGLVVLAFVVVLFVNAQNSTPEAKKAASEVSANCAKCPTASTCTQMGETKTAACDPAKCKEANCDMTLCKEGKCDPATCKVNCPAKSGEVATSAPAACEATCPMKSALKAN
jgi:hypothetical protein